MKHRLGCFLMSSSHEIQPGGRYIQASRISTATLQPLFSHIFFLARGLATDEIRDRRSAGGLAYMRAEFPLKPNVDSMQGQRSRRWPNKGREFVVVQICML